MIVIVGRGILVVDVVLVGIDSQDDKYDNDTSTNGNSGRTPAVGLSGRPLCPLIIPPVVSFVDLGNQTQRESNSQHLWQEFE